MSRRFRLKSRRFLLFLIVLLVVGGGAFGALRGRMSNKGTPVQTEDVSRGEIVEIVAATGRVQPQSEVKISANVSGRIDHLEVKEGDRVELGQVLVEIDPTRYGALVLEAEAGLRSARAESRLADANLEQSRRDVERQRRMHAQKLGSEGDLEAAETALKVAEARRDASVEAVNRAEAYLTQARDDRSKTTILAPKPGVVTRLNVEVGEVVLGTTQNVGTTLMTIADLGQMEVLAEVDESEVVKVSLGDSARIELDALEGKVFRGLVSEMANSATTRGRGTVEEATHFEIKVALLGDVTSLRPGMTATLDLVTERREGVLHLPIQCVTLRAKEEPEKGDRKGREGGAASGREGHDERQGRPDHGNTSAEAGGTGGASSASNLREVVYVVRGGVAHEIDVKTGISSPTDIEILGQDLAEGDEVVSGSYRVLARELADGDRVRVDNASLRRAGNRGSGHGGEDQGGEASNRDERGGSR